MRIALALAERGMHVFPLRPSTKAPAVHRDWEGCATTDPDRIAAWWERSAYNIGIATGPSQLVVVDLDAPKQRPESGLRAPHGRQVLGALARAAGASIPRATFTVVTAGGGQHLYFRAPDGPILHNTAGRLGPSIDTRATGGYVVGPGSSVDRRRYRVVENAEPAPLPAWIIAKLTTHPPAASEVDRGQCRHGSAYVRAAMEGEARRVANAPVGQRNHALFTAAARLARFVPEGRLTVDDIDSLLTGACAVHLGVERFTAEEIRRTISSGLRRGQSATSPTRRSTDPVSVPRTVMPHEPGASR